MQSVYRCYWNAMQISFCIAYKCIVMQFNDRYNRIFAEIDSVSVVFIVVSCGVADWLVHQSPMVGWLVGSDNITTGSSSSWTIHRRCLSRKFGLCRLRLQRCLVRSVNWDVLCCEIVSTVLHGERCACSRRRQQGQLIWLTVRRVSRSLPKYKTDDVELWSSIDDRSSACLPFDRFWKHSSSPPTNEQ